jgi:hypothetical protein
VKKIALYIQSEYNNLPKSSFHTATINQEKQLPARFHKPAIVDIQSELKLTICNFNYQTVVKTASDIFNCRFCLLTSNQVIDLCLGAVETASNYQSAVKTVSQYI